MKTCSDQRGCRNSNPQPRENFGKRNGVPDGLRYSCKACDARARAAHNEEWREKKRADERKRYRENRILKGKTKPEYFLTNTEERAADPYKCIALDVLTVALMDYRNGKCGTAFFVSDEFDLFCEAAGMNPEWIRRGVLSYES